MSGGRSRHAARWAAAVLLGSWLAACGDAPVGAPTDGAPEPDFDPQQLLSDAELLTTADPNAPTENPDWSEWAIANFQPIRSLQSDDLSDLEFLREHVADRRIVQLGESGHGVREFNHLKVRLIKYLHQELGFDVLAFESSLFECALANRALAEASALASMVGCTFGVWHTEEVLELFEYVRATQSGPRPIRLAGVDTQISADSTVQFRPGFFKNLVAHVDPAYADTVFALDQDFLDNYTRTLAGRSIYLLASRTRLVAEYTRLADFLAAHEEVYAALGPETQVDALVAEQTARSMVAFTLQMATESDTSTEHRDLGMADNVSFVSDQLFPGAKIMVWAHNFHVRHANHDITPLPAPRTMGGWLKERYGDDLYSVGLYAYRGLMADNGRTVYAVGPATTGSVESVLYRPRRRWVFMDLTSAPQDEAGTGWIHGQVTAQAWGTNPLTMVPAEQYDGLILVHTVSAPDYLF